MNSERALRFSTTRPFTPVSYSSSLATRYRWPSCSALFRRPAFAVNSSRRSLVRVFPRKGKTSSSISIKALSTLSLTRSRSAMVSCSCSIQPLAALSRPSAWGDSRSSPAVGSMGTPYCVSTDHLRVPTVALSGCVCASQVSESTLSRSAAEPISLSVPPDCLFRVDRKRPPASLAECRVADWLGGRLVGFLSVFRRFCCVGTVVSSPLDASTSSCALLYPSSGGDDGGDWDWAMRYKLR